MPVYEYRCKKCGEVHQEVKPVDERHDPQECECGGPCFLIISRPGRFRRGSGWAARMDGATMPGEVG